MEMDVHFEVNMKFKNEKRTDRPPFFRALLGLEEAKSVKPVKMLEDKNCSHGSASTSRRHSSPPREKHPDKSRKSTRYRSRSQHKASETKRHSSVEHAAKRHHKGHKQRRRTESHRHH